MQQVAWKEQVRQKPRQLSSTEQLQPGAGCQAGLEPAGEQGLGQERAWPLPAGLQQWEHSSSRDQGRGAELEGRVLAKGGQGLLLPASLRAISCAVSRLALCLGSQMIPLAQENVLSTLQK